MKLVTESNLERRRAKVESLKSSLVETVDGGKIQNITPDQLAQILEVLAKKDISIKQLPDYMYEINDGIKLGLNFEELMNAVRNSVNADELGAYIYHNSDPKKYDELYPNDRKAINESLDKDVVSRETYTISVSYEVPKNYKLRPNCKYTIYYEDTDEDYIPESGEALSDLIQDAIKELDENGSDWFNTATIVEINLRTEDETVLADLLWEAKDWSLTNSQELELKRYSDQYGYDWVEINDGLNWRIRMMQMNVPQAIEDVKEAMAAGDSLYESFNQYESDSINKIEFIYDDTNNKLVDALKFFDTVKDNDFNIIQVRNSSDNSLDMEITKNSDNTYDVVYQGFYRSWNGPGYHIRPAKRKRSYKRLNALFDFITTWYNVNYDKIKKEADPYYEDMNDSPLLYNIKESKNPLKAAARKHKRKQKGLSPFSYLNPNAGDVEYNIDFFNKAMGSGDATGTEGGEGLGESMKEELRIWGDEEISAQNNLVKWEHALEDFLENNNIEYDQVKCDVFDYGTNIVIVNPEDIEEVAQEIEDHYGFKTTIEDNNIYVDVTEEYEDEYGDIKTRVAKRYHESYNDEGYTLQYLNDKNEIISSKQINNPLQATKLFKQALDNGENVSLIDNETGEEIEEQEVDNYLLQVGDEEYDYDSNFEEDFDSNIFNIRHELNKLDFQNYGDLLNMYDSLDLTAHERQHIADLIIKKDRKALTDYLQELVDVQINVYDGNGNGIVTNEEEE